jgi:hypothetical protein
MKEMQKYGWNSIHSSKWSTSIEMDLVVINGKISTANSAIL